MPKVRLRIAGVGAKGASMFIGSIHIDKPEHSYRIGAFGGGASVGSLILTDWMDLRVPQLNKIGALDQWYITIGIEKAVVGIKDTKVSITLSTKEKHLDVKTPVRVECIGLALDGINFDGQLQLNYENKDDPRFDPRSLFASGTEKKSHLNIA